MKIAAALFRRSRCWSLVLGVLGVVTIGIAAWVWLGRVKAEPVPAYGAVPDFALVERGGKTVRRADLLGKVSVVDFFYTRCTDACPLQSAHLAQLQAHFATAPDLRLVSITVDPDYDTPAVLSAYAARLRADPSRWLFLTGPRTAIYRLAVDGFHLAAITSSSSSPGSSHRAPGSGHNIQRQPWAWMRPASAWAHEDNAGSEKTGSEKTGSEIVQLVHASWFALVDRQGTIRGYFDGIDGKSMKSLQKQLEQRLRHH